MKFCGQCGGELVERVPAGDDRLRMVCTRCAHVHYQNPLVIVGCIVERGADVLLCRRAIEPAHGKWTLPAGFLELGESVAAGARRETWEEAGARVAVVAPHSLLDLPHIGQHYAMFRAHMLTEDLAPGAESLECAFFAADRLPWAELAFPAVHFALRLWLDDRTAGRHHVHHGQLVWNGHGSRFDPANYSIAEHLRTPVC